MYVCMYVCMYVYIYIYVCIHICVGGLFGTPRQHRSFVRVCIQLKMYTTSLSKGVTSTQKSTYMRSAYIRGCQHIFYYGTII